MILLDSSEIKEKEAVCYIDTQTFDGKALLSKKKASSLTQRNYYYIIHYFIFHHL